MKKLLAMAAGLALVAGVVACTSHKTADDADQTAMNDTQSGQETVVVAEEPTQTITKGEY